MTKQIPLSQQKRSNSRNAGLVALVDDEDYEWLSQWNWSAVSTQRRNGGYAMRRDNRSGKNFLMHRVLLDAPEGIEVDHINGNGLDNRRENLRLVTLQKNRQNRSRGRNNQTGYKGVTFDKKSGTRVVYGEHAKTNFQEPDIM